MNRKWNDTKSSEKAKKEGNEKKWKEKGRSEEENTLPEGVDFRVPAREAKGEVGAARTRLGVGEDRSYIQDMRGAEIVVGPFHLEAAGGVVVAFGRCHGGGNQKQKQKQEQEQQRQQQRRLSRSIDRSSEAEEARRRRRRHRRRSRRRSRSRSGSSGVCSDRSIDRQKQKQKQKQMKHEDEDEDEEDEEDDEDDEAGNRLFEVFSLDLPAIAGNRRLRLIAL
jgi:hypothetical protein